MHRLPDSSAIAAHEQRDLHTTAGHRHGKAGSSGTCSSKSTCFARAAALRTSQDSIVTGSSTTCPRAATKALNPKIGTAALSYVHWHGWDVALGPLRLQVQSCVALPNMLRHASGS